MFLSTSSINESMRYAALHYTKNGRSILVNDTFTGENNAAFRKIKDKYMVSEYIRYNTTHLLISYMCYP